MKLGVYKTVEGHTAVIHGEGDTIRYQADGINNTDACWNLRKKAMKMMEDANEMLKVLEPWISPKEEPRDKRFEKV